MKRNLTRTWRKARVVWWRTLRETHSMLYRQEMRRLQRFSNVFCQTHQRKDGEEHVRVVVTQVADELDYIDEVVLDRELDSYRLAGFPIEVAPQDKEKEFVRPLWAIEVFQNGRLARQITYYLQPMYPDKSPCDAVDTEAPSPLKNE